MLYSGGADLVYDGTTAFSQYAGTFLIDLSEYESVILLIDTGSYIYINKGEQGGTGGFVSNNTGYGRSFLFLNDGTGIWYSNCGNYSSFVGNVQIKKIYGFKFRLI